VRVEALALNLSLTLPSLKMGEGTIDILKICPRFSKNRKDSVYAFQPCTETSISCPAGS
jgi:hypothetical protein